MNSRRYILFIAIGIIVIGSSVATTAILKGKNETAPTTVVETLNSNAVSDTDLSEVGELIDAGNIKAVCPKGWTNSPVKDPWSSDENALDKNALYFIKGASDSWDVFSHPSIRIDYYGEDNIITDTRDFYTEVSDVNLKINGVEWVGFTGKSGEYLNGVLSIKDSGAICVSLCLQTSTEQITIEDEDIKTILGSIVVTEPETDTDTEKVTE